jgi:hypothetical protein
MKIIIKEDQLKKILNEDLGVSRPAIAYTNLIFKKIQGVVLDFVKNTKKKNDKKIEHLVIGLDDIKTIWQNDIDDFLELPIEVINLKIELYKTSNKKKDLVFGSGGGAYQVEEKKTGSSYLKRPSLLIPKYVLENPEVNKTLVSNIDFQVYITENYNDNFEKELLFDVRDTIFHEMNHVLEFYKRGLEGTSIDPRLTYSGGKNYNIPKEIFQIWNRFLTYLYYSEPFEINAMTQEMYSKRLRMTFEELQQENYYKISKKMESFDADSFFDMLVSKIEEISPDKVIYILVNLYKWFMRDYLSISKSEGLEPNKKITSSKEILSLMKKLEPRIQKAGDKLLRNFRRLYSINSEV